MLRIGSRAQVMHGNAKMTGGGLKKKDLKYNKQGKIVSKKMSSMAKKEKRLQKAGYTTKKGQFGAGPELKNIVYNMIQYRLYIGNFVMGPLSNLEPNEKEKLIKKFLNIFKDKRTTMSEFSKKLEDTYENRNDRNKFNKPGDINILKEYFDAFRKFCTVAKIPDIEYTYDDFKTKDQNILTDNYNI